MRPNRLKVWLVMLNYFPIDFKVIFVAIKVNEVKRKHRNLQTIKLKDQLLVTGSLCCLLANTSPHQFKEGVW